MPSMIPLFGFYQSRAFKQWIDRCPQVPADKAPEPLMIKGPHIHKKGEAGFR
jgi:trehalose utilization protein